MLGQVSLAEIFKDIKPTITPLSQADVDTLRNYVMRLQAEQPLNPLEARDFYRISNIITHEYPTNQKSWLLWVIGGFLLGAILSTDNKK